MIKIVKDNLMQYASNQFGALMSIKMGDTGNCEIVDPKDWVKSDALDAHIAAWKEFIDELEEFPTT